MHALYLIYHLLNLKGINKVQDKVLKAYTMSCGLWNKIGKIVLILKPISHSDQSPWYMWTKLWARIDHAMSSMQSFFHFASCYSLLVEPLVDVVLLYYFPIQLCIEWKVVTPKPMKGQFFLNMTFLSHKATSSYILCIWNLKPHPIHDIDWI